MLSDVLHKLIEVVLTNFRSIISLSIVLYVTQYYINYFTRPSKIPGPFPFPIIGNIHQIGSDFPLALEKFRKQFGSLYEIYMGGKRIVIISRPDLAEQVWGPVSVKNTKFIMRSSYSEGVDELGLGTRGIVLNRDVESWAINRKFLIQCSSSPSFLREAIKLSSKINNEIFEYWKVMEEKGMSVEFSEWMDALGADVVVTTATGKRMTSTAQLFDKLNIKGEKSKIQGVWEDGIKFTKSIHVYNESMSFMMLFSPFFRRNVPGFKSINKNYLDVRDWINNELEKMISERRKEIENTPLDQPLEPTILTLLLTTNTERDLNKIIVGKFDRPLKDEEISSILREVFTGGLDTTANTLSFLTYYIAKDRQVYLRMREEVLNVFGTLDNPELVLESYERLKYIDAVIHEAIRVFPTLSIMPRASTEDVEFDGFKVEADTTVYTDLRALSHNPKYFEDPEKFNPDRFFSGKDSIAKFTFLPFGHGARLCPGRAWSMVQMKTFLVKLVSTFDLELVDKNAELKYKYATANRPVDINLYIRVRKD